MTTPEQLQPEPPTVTQRHEALRNPEPDFIYQAMGAGVQSTAIAILAANGRIPKPKFAVFADTGWEPKEVYDHLDNLEAKVLKPAGITLLRVGEGDIFNDSVDPHYNNVMPVYLRKASGDKAGVIQRGCTPAYKLAPIFRWLREELGASVKVVECRYCKGSGERDAPWLVRAGLTDTAWGVCSICRGTGSLKRVGTPPRGRWARSYVGFSSDEIQRVKPGRAAYEKAYYPLIDALDIPMSRTDCIQYLEAQGWHGVSKSACIGCPFRSNEEWRDIKAVPAEWEQAVRLDRAVRHLPLLEGVGYLHKDRIPLEEADIGGDDPADADGDRPSCSPYGCRSEDGLEVPMEMILGDDLSDTLEETVR